MEQHSIGLGIITKEISDKSIKLPKDTIVKVLSFPTKETTTIKFKDKILDVQNNNLSLLCIHCLTEIEFSKKEEHQSIHHPEIIINSYTFKLLYKMENESYIKVKIKNIERNLDFIVYQSNSHCNLYRFCSIWSDKTFYKGDKDYVTETFIHMDLQKFIVENFRNLIEKENEECPYKTDNLTLSLEKIKPFWQYIKERQIVFDSENFLNKIAELRCGEGFSNIYKIIGIIVDIQKNPSEFLSRDLISDFNILIGNILKIFYKDKKIEDFRIELIQLYLDLYKKNKNGEESGLEIRDKKNIMRLYLEFISSYMNYNYNILTEYKELYETVSRMKKYPSKEFKFKFFSVDIQHKENSKIYSVIFALYKFGEEAFSIILNIIPHEDNGNHINSIGLYKKVISMGIYLCKPLDYSHQIQTLMRGFVSEEYHFVGDLYDNLFPVKRR